MSGRAVVAVLGSVIAVGATACGASDRITVPAARAAAQAPPIATSSATAQSQEGRPPMAVHPSNHLASETSPYLLQHAHNPVDWYPWGPEAFARAKAEDKPLFLSVGYAACHWCHVMERESFENEAIAALMNASFICVKVDREERPDVDEIYMKAVQALTRSGGWPMSVWLTPDAKPFYGGTYFPPEDRYGRAGFPRVCQEMARVWKDERERVLRAADGLTEQIREISAPAPVAAGEANAELPAGLLARAAERMLRAFDDENGGFGQAPKFPHSMDLSLLLRIDARLGHPAGRKAAEFTLQKMAAGGMYDQLGGAFHRYSVDDHWLVPHFEKMLYDNALLAGTYLDGWLATGDVALATIVREIGDWALREMQSPAGGFYATQDADSEGEEGRFFAWDPADLAAVLGADDAVWVGSWFGVTAAGNFEHGKSVLSRPQTIAELAKARGKAPEVVIAELAAARAKLLAARSQRVAPLRDDKMLADWNGLMIGALARAGFHLGEPRYLAAAAGAAECVRAKLWSADRGGRLLRSFKDGRARHDGNLADYAFLAEGLLDLYQARFEPADLAFAKQLVDVTIARFWDEEGGGFWFTGEGHETLIARSKEAYDGATPSGPSVHVLNLLRLAELTGEEGYRKKALRTLKLYQPLLEQQPQAVSRMLAAVDFLESKPREIVLVGASMAALQPFLEVLRGGLDLNRVVLVVTPETRAALSALTPLIEGKTATDRATAFVCRDGSCKLAVTTPDKFAEQLRGEQ